MANSMQKRFIHQQQPSNLIPNGWLERFCAVFSGVLNAKQVTIYLNSYKIYRCFN